MNIRTYFFIAVFLIFSITLYVEGEVGISENIILSGVASLLVTILFPIYTAVLGIILAGLKLITMFLEKVLEKIVED